MQTITGRFIEVWVAPQGWPLEGDIPAIVLNDELHLQWRFNLLLAQASASVGVELKIELVLGDGGPSAEAETNPDKITISRSLLKGIHNFFFHALATAHTFQGEDLDGESCEPPYLGVKDEKYYLAEFVKADGALPSTFYRWALAFTMKWAALDFILLHEIGHICLGARDLEKLREPSLTRLETQTIEFDCDAFAACLLSEVWKQNGAKLLGRQEGAIRSDILEQWLGENGSAFVLALVAYFTVTRMDLKLSWSFDDIFGPKAHPPVAVRRMATWMHLAAWLKTHVPAINKPFEFLEQMFASGGKLFCEAVGENFDGMAAEIEAWGSDMGDYLKELTTIRKELLPQLQQYQRGTRVVKVDGVG